MQKKYVKISVIMPLYNAAKYLRRAIDSIVKQTYPHVEIIVVDGGSVDGTQEIVKEYGEKIAYFISEPDRGYGDALNKGLAVATGDYYIILAGDDFFIPTGLERFANYINSHSDVDVWCGNMLVVKEKGIVTVFKRANTLEELEHNKCMAHPATFFRIQTLVKLGGYDISYKIGCDLELILRMYKMGCSFFLSDEKEIITVFECGGMSVKEDISDSFSMLKEISDTELIVAKHGGAKWRARWFRIQDLFKKCIVRALKQSFTSVSSRKLLYRLNNQQPLSDEELRSYQVDTSII